MGYATGIALNVAALLAALRQFMIDQGWQQLDEIEAGKDYVLTSNGMIYRITIKTAAGFPVKFNGNAARAFDYVIVRGYSDWDEVTHTGVGEYGYAGSAITFNKNNNFNYGLRLENPADVYPTTPRIHQHNITNGPNALWDGRRKFAWSAFDFSVIEHRVRDWRGNAHQFGFNGNGQHYETRKPVLVHDYATDTDFLYWIVNSTVRPNQHWRLNLATGAWTMLAEPSWTYDGAGCAASRGCWDGGDFIYWLRGSNTVHFARYQISTGTWTNLTNAPMIARSDQMQLSSGTGCAGTGAEYVPAAVTGLSQDVIYCQLGINNYDGGTANTIYRNDVTDNAWRAFGAGGISINNQFGTGLLFDGEKYLYVQESNANAQIHRADMRALHPTNQLPFVNLGSHETLGIGSWRSMAITRTLVGKVRAHGTLETRYHFVGDGDGIAIVTRIFTAPNVSNNYWMGFGKVNSTYQASPVAYVDGEVTAGPRKDINVFGRVGDFVAGQRVQLYDPAANVLETVTIYDVPSPNHIRATLTRTWPDGTIIAIEPTNYGIFSDHGVASFPATHLGYYADHEADWYFCDPRDDLTIRTPTPRGTYLPAPIHLWHDNAFYTNAKKEPRGYLKHLGAIAKSAATSAPKDGHAIKVGADTFLTFTVTEADRIAASQYMIVIGPVA